MTPEQLERAKTDRQFRALRNRIFSQGTALLFGANAAVAAAIVQWVLRDAPPTDTTPTVRLTINLVALAAASIHAAGAWHAVKLPMVRVLQFWRDLRSGRVEDPEIAAPMMALAMSGRCFVAGVVVLTVGLVLRELWAFVY